MRIILFALLLLYSTNGKAQNIIKGKVIDAVSHQPLEGAIVSEKNNNNKTITSKTRRQGIDFIARYQ